MEKQYWKSEVQTPIGELQVVATEKGVSRVGWDSERSQGRTRFETKNPPRHLKEACVQLRQYFGRKRTSFDVPLDLEGTPFQLAAWRALLKIPYGRTVSYEDQALALGNRKYTRAVGGANHRNPVPIFVPCHRVIGKNGKLTGFGGGLPTKRYLLDLERDLPK